ncbi:Pre-mRNA-processing protein [Vigna angularis]|uniref:Pre-mRNA-processing protein n=1 Tax=Phaseolus angularis TaxID=3914 RepID=A0A8T0KQH0_PHAAN|nr:pre-mRNA-processing protein 40A [Vigna angularis]XP_017414409.1 pre-mRNA-processing protein 40A [Vigna angularis]XP_017414410.1 pre-mRNA-processing protein 40A [Vigna angularis]XP_052730274.1 pre-mRNA-processing protein 40A [Vigna angularis]KAG2401372.1 Pre-mRNA-processing protein [Vigna angularis]
MSNNPQYPGLQPLRPPISGSVDPPRNYAPPMPVQFRPVVPAQQPQQFISMPSQHYQHHHHQPVGPGGVPMIGVGMPPQNQQPQFSQPIQQLPPRPSPQLPPPSQAIPMPVARPNLHIPSESMMPQPDSQAPNGYTPGVGGPGMALSSSYTFAAPTYGQVQTNFNSTGQFQPVPQVHALTGSSSQSITTGTTLQSNGGGQPLVPTVMPSATIVPPQLAKNGSTDWIEHTTATGRTFYYNKKTKVSSWEKPFELMTPIERVDESTNWKEYISPDGRKYFYNKVTKESKWLIPEELKLAREQVEKAIASGPHSEALLNSHTQPSPAPSVAEATLNADNISVSSQGEPSSPVSVAPVVTTSTSTVQPEMPSGPSTSPSSTPITGTKVDELEAPVNTVTLSDTSMGGDKAVDTDVSTAITPTNDTNNDSNQDALGSADGVPAEEKEDGKTDSIGERSNHVAAETKAVEPETLVFANKMEAKDAFKALLDSANVGSDWTWDRAMRLIINDKRYGALKTLGERKQAFNEYLNHRKKHEAEEKRMKQKKAREDFKKMLEESTDLTSSTRWSKAVSIFENDERFKAVERDRDRRDMFESFLEELVNKERSRVQEERKRNIMEYKKFLESCDFIKASTQWRKVQDRLEADERCSCLEKIDRLEIFQDYLRDLEKEEEEQKKIQKEELRKTERKNRDEFRKLMEEHIASGILTAKTHWRDYYTKVKDLHAYIAVASNTSGSTPKDLYEDVAEELDKQYHEEKSRIKDAMKLAKITLFSTWTFEDFKSALSKDIGTSPISDFNLKLVFEELLERVKEKEEKEAKKRKRLADDFFHLLYSIKDITVSSNWEDSIPLVEDSQEFRSIGDESLCKEVFEEYIAQLKEEAKESERIRKEERMKKEKDREERERRKGKQRREKDGGRERGKDEAHKKDKADSDSMELSEIQSSKENKRSEDDSRKQRKQRHSPEHEMDKEKTKKSHGHGSDRKKSKRRASGHESDEGRHKRHKRDHRREGDHGDLEDGEFGDGVDRW